MREKNYVAPCGSTIKIEEGTYGYYVTIEDRRAFAAVSKDHEDLKEQFLDYKKIRFYVERKSLNTVMQILEDVRKWKNEEENDE